MEDALSFRDMLLEIARGFTSALADLFPRLAAALIVMLLGVGVAKLSEFVLRRVFRRIALESLLEKLGVTALLSRVGWTHGGCRPIERGVYYLILFLFVQQSARVLGLTPISSFLDAALGYAPRVFTALAVVVAGALLASVAGRMAEAGAKGVGVEFATILGRVISGAAMTVAVIIAFDQLEIDSFLPQNLVMGAFLGVVLGLALTFGLGTRDLSRNILAGSYARRIFEPGCEIEVAGERGILVAITPLQTLLKKGDKVIAVPNSVYLDEVVKS